jgi:succinate dehydrogenase / fumarate reductase, cytochrome b subunit
MAQVSFSGGSARRKAPFPIELYRSAVGKKYVMALTGLVLIGFVIGHMLGNLKMYLGAASTGRYEIDHYGEFLREMGSPILPHGVLLWIIRFVLIGAFVAHMHAAYSLTVMNRKARTVRYQSKRDYVAANWASRSMRYTGLIVIAFVFWHLADLTWGLTSDRFEHGDVYNNLDATISRWWVAIFYVVANLALGVHLFHGVWSLFQSMGWSNPRFNAWRRQIAVAIAALVVIGNVSFPVAILTGIVDSPVIRG